jgi:hypothetical protein
MYDVRCMMYDLFKMVRHTFFYALQVRKPCFPGKRNITNLRHHTS